MRLKPSHLLLLMAATLGLTFWLTRPAPAPAGTAGSRPATACPLPDAAARSLAHPPLQTAAPRGLILPHADGRITALAGFSLQARVLGSKAYRHGAEARYSPLDLALGWGPMSHDAVLGQLAISQSGRWYHYRWQGQPPLPPAQIRDHSANMHMIPGSPQIAAALAQIKPDQTIRLHGWLVSVSDDNQWQWRSSLSRSDSGAGACEVVYVCGLEVL